MKTDQQQGRRRNNNKIIFFPLRFRSGHENRCVFKKQNISRLRLEKPQVCGKFLLREELSGHK